MTQLAPITNVTPVAWRAQPGETEREHLHFLHWALCGGPLNADMAARHRWTERKNVLDQFEALEAVSPNDQVLEATLKRVRVTFLEMNKLERKSLENPDDNVLSTREILDSITWLAQQSKDFAAARANMLDWSDTTPEEREILLQAAKIQDRLMGKE